MFEHCERIYCEIHIKSLNYVVALLFEMNAFFYVMGNTARNIMHLRHRTRQRGASSKFYECLE